MAVRFLRFPACLILTGAGILSVPAVPGAPVRAAAEAPAPGQTPAQEPTPAPAPAPGPVQDRIPAITAMTPASGPAGTQVILRGTSLGGATEVDFGELRATAMTAVSATEVHATVPQGLEPGPASVVVVTPAGTAIAPDPFTVTAPPEPLPE